MSMDLVCVIESSPSSFDGMCTGSESAYPET